MRISSLALLGTLAISSTSFAGAATSKPAARWPDGIVEYKFQLTGAAALFSDEQRQINETLAWYSAYTPLLFRAALPGSLRPYLLYEKAATSPATTGCIGLALANGSNCSGNTVTSPSLASGPANVVDLVTSGGGAPAGGNGLRRETFHETGHAIGLYHEQSRLDAAQTIDFFQQCYSGSVTPRPDEEHFGPYDLNSIMQYKSWSQCIQGGTPPVPAPPGGTADCICYPFWEKMSGIDPTTASVSFIQQKEANNPGKMIIPADEPTPDDINGLWHMYEPKLGTEQAGNRFGNAVAAGDFDGDGYEDVAVGAWNDNLTSGGAVYLYKGTAQGLVAWRKIAESSFTTAGSADQFGWSLAAGDLDGDGYVDLAVGAPGRLSNAGGAWIFFGGAAGPTIPLPAPVSTTPLVRYYQSSVFGDTTHVGDKFGTALAFGKFNGQWGLAIGAPGKLPSGGQQSGYVYVLAWNNTSKALTKVDAFGPQRWGDDVANATFGAALAAGDFTADGYDDLWIGAPSYLGGKIYLAKGSAGTMTAGFSAAKNGVMRFGSALAVGNFDGRLISQGTRIRPGLSLAVGAPGTTVNGLANAGQLQVFASTFDGSGNFAGIAAQTPITAPIPTANDQYGAALAAGPINSDSKEDLVIGMPMTSGRGAVRIALGTSTGLTATGGQRVDNPHQVGAFGSSVAVVHAMRNGYVVGAPQQVTAANVAAGQILHYELPASQSGLPAILGWHSEGSGVFK